MLKKNGPTHSKKVQLGAGLNLLGPHLMPEVEMALDKESDKWRLGVSLSNAPFPKIEVQHYTLLSVQINISFLKFDLVTQ